jgi:glycosyltransferase involved in cell wall biosynthesis
VVATRAGALPEVLGDAAELVPVGDREALATAMASVLGSDERRATLIARGRARAASFTWEACAAGMADLYRDAVADGG